MSITGKRKPSNADTARKWDEFTREVIQQTNIEDAYRRMGVEIVGTKPNASGWLAVRAVGRPDTHPSAAINVGDDSRRGRYKDLGGDGDSLSLFDFAVRYGGIGVKDRNDARKWFAQEAGIARRAPREKAEDLLDSIRLLPHTVLDRHIKGLVAAYPGVTVEGIKLCGGVYGKWPANSPEPNHCVILPAYGTDLLDSDPCGYTLMRADGMKLRVFSGEGVPPRQEKRINKGKSGLVGSHGLKRIDKAELIWKVEGISDLLALQSIIPESYRDRHVVVTNNSGATEISLPGEVAHLFSTRTVCVLHDCDEPGQNGAGVWLNALANANCTVKNVVLPYEVTANHGKDLRDWISEGHSYQDLLDLAAGIPAAAKAKVPAASPATETKPDSRSNPESYEPQHHGDSLHGDPTAGYWQGDNTQQVGVTPHQEVLRRVGLLVLGEIAGTETITCYSIPLQKTFEIRDIARFKYEHALQCIGGHCEKILAQGINVDATQIHFSSLLKAISIEGGKKSISSSQQLGQGVWEVCDRLVLVNHKEAAILNGSFVRVKTPCVDDRLIDIRSSDPWFDFDRIAELYAASESDEWCRDQYREAVALFAKWSNFVHSDSPELMAGLVIVTWLQTVWEWRPIVAITGATNTGKSWLVEKTLPHIYGHLGMPCSKPTEAGLRQRIGNTAKVILIDEFEHDKHRQSVMELARTSSRGTSVIRGTANQRGTTFGLRHIIWCGAIELGLNREADRNRMLLMELGKIPSDQPRMELPPAEELENLGLRLFAVALRHWRSCRDMAKALCRMPFEGVDNRANESYSLPVAMISTILGETLEEGRARMLRSFIEREMVQDSVSDEDDLLLAILSSQVEIGSGRKMTVSELMAADSLDSNATIPVDRNEILQRNGIKVGDGEIFLGPQMVCRTVLKFTDYANQSISQILMRVTGAKKRVWRVLGMNTKGVSIPVASFQKILPRVASADGVVPGLDFGDEGPESISEGGWDRL